MIMIFIDNFFIRALCIIKQLLKCLVSYGMHIDKCTVIFYAGKGCSMVLADIQNTSEIVYSALLVIIKLCKSILNAKICMYDLEKCRGNVEQLQALCNAANSGNTPLCPKSNHVKSAMELCSEKFDYVEKFSKMIEVVVKHCNKISKGT